MLDPPEAPQASLPASGDTDAPASLSASGDTDAPEFRTPPNAFADQTPERAKPRSRRRIMAALHQGSVVFFGVFGAFFLSIYTGLWVSMGLSLLWDWAPLWFLKFVAVPLALEAGLGLGGAAVLYLLGRFVELPRVAAQVGFWAGLHGLDLLMKWLLGQFPEAYGSLRIWLLRLPVMILFFILGHFAFRAALRRRPD